MEAIQSESDFKQRLAQLDARSQQQFALRLVDAVRGYCDDGRLLSVLAAVERNDGSPAELESAAKSARAMVVSLHTRCGADGDWAAQAGYFVARAADVLIRGLLRPEDNLAYRVAQNCRMAATCVAVDGETEAGAKQMAIQWGLLDDYLAEQRGK